MKSQFNITDKYIAGKVTVALDKKDNYCEITLIEMKSCTDVTFAGRIVPFEKSMIGSYVQLGKSFLPEPGQGFGKGTKSDALLIMNFLNGSKF